MPKEEQMEQKKYPLEDITASRTRTRGMHGIIEYVTMIEYNVQRLVCLAVLYWTRTGSEVEHEIAAVDDIADDIKADY